VYGFNLALISTDFVLCKVQQAMEFNLALSFLHLSLFYSMYFNGIYLNIQLVKFSLCRSSGNSVSPSINYKSCSIYHEFQQLFIFFGATGTFILLNRKYKKGISLYRFLIYTQVIIYELKIS